jgi:hypothetical protein
VTPFLFYRIGHPVYGVAANGTARSAGPAIIHVTPEPQSGRTANENAFHRTGQVWVRSGAREGLLRRIPFADLFHTRSWDGCGFRTQQQKTVQLHTGMVTGPLHLEFYARVKDTSGESSAHRFAPPASRYPPTVLRDLLIGGYLSLRHSMRSRQQYRQSRDYRVLGPMLGCRNANLNSCHEVAAARHAFECNIRRRK